MPSKQGQYTIVLDSSPSVVGFASIGSKMEAKGPMANYIDILNEDSYFGQTTWEKAESNMQQQVALKALDKCGMPPEQVECAFAGDLLNQCIGSHYGLRELGIPLFGLYSACATMAEGLALAGQFVDSGTAKATLALTSSHFCSAERQYRFPLEYGCQRTPNSQWTVTGAGAAVVGQNSAPPYLRAFQIGGIVDLGQKDINNMGAAMAPAAAQTLTRFFQDTLTNQDNYDLILTGDLALVGSTLLHQLMHREGYDISKKHADCGLLIYDRDRQMVDAGGSGAGCSAVVLCSYIMQSMREGKLNDVLFVATGALMSTTSFQQGETIPCVAHLVHLSTAPGKSAG